MSDTKLKNKIKKSLHKLKDGDLPQSARALLGLLGYESERISKLDGDPQAFIEQFPVLSHSSDAKSENSRTKSEQSFLKAAKSVHIIFQITSEEIKKSAQLNLLEIQKFDLKIIQSFLFVAVRLKPADYARGKYAQMAREVNKRLGIATIVLFMNGNKATIAFMGRRVHKNDPNRDVLGKVFLIRDIDCVKPHRAHLDILSELSLHECLNWIEKNSKDKNFDGLLAAWLKTLDTEELNKRFYKKLHAWYERAVKIAKFPLPDNKPITAQDQVIRLITRILFVWFIKEKSLVAEDLFIETQIQKLLKNYRPDGDDYYRAILQNLFFATLNTEITQRRFSKKNNSTHRNFNLYRYKSMLSDKKVFLKLMKKTPFINGGLFDCLDSKESTSAGGYRLDCFTDYPKHRKQLSVPNYLFFHNEKGLFPLLNRYKFTVEENTPVEQEVALDPELLGKVFENLLAAYNLETRRASARKQTGSYYTPRVIVDYMAGEALLAYLGEKVKSYDGDVRWWKDRLRYLLDYEDAFADAKELFTDNERQAVIKAIATIRVLDPAVGSGAFPMGVLHKLALVLRRVDPDNEIWEKLQKDRARERLGAAVDTDNPDTREEELTEISRTFETYRNTDFGRKLYLIQNSIFGVDIQPIACQIAKLRFFISLTIEQTATNNANDNYGIKPLPNLETRFVSANTLLGLEKSGQVPLKRFIKNTDVIIKLKRNREQHFNASNRSKKLECIRKGKELRQQLKQELKDCFSADEAEKIANWDPYDQNTHADWFDPEWMFGIKDGFDIVLGNPPYIQLQRNGGKLGHRYRNAGYESFASTGDIYQLFMEKGCSLLKPKHGVLSYITSNSWLKAEYGKATRRYFAKQHTPLRLLEMGKDIFENTIVDTSILIVRNGKSKEAGKAVDMDSLSDKSFPPDEKIWGELRMREGLPWIVLSNVEQSIMDKMETVGTPLANWDVSILYGIKTGYNNAFIIDTEAKDVLVAKDPKSEEIIKPVLRGRDIQRYRAKWAGKWLIYTRRGIPIKQYPAVYDHLLQHQDALSKKAGANEWYELQASPSDEADSRFQMEKLLWIELVENGRFSYNNSGIYGEATTFIMTGEYIKYLCAVLNTKLIFWFLKQTAPTSGMGTLRWKKVYVERIPIPKITATKQQHFVDLVDKILKAKQNGTDTTTLEAKIDKMVYQLYNLTADEIKIIEQK